MPGGFAGRLPEEWFTGPAVVTVDREEITIVGTLSVPEEDAPGPGFAEGRIKRFREQTRERRIEVAREAEHRFQRKGARGVPCGAVREMFTTLSRPGSTRLAPSERPAPAPLPAAST